MYPVRCMSSKGIARLLHCIRIIIIMEQHYSLPRDSMIRIFLILVLFKIGSAQNKDNDLSIGYAKKTWFEYFEDCDLASFPPNNIATVGWLAGIYLNTYWMAFEGCYDILFYYAGMTTTPFNSSKDAKTACSNICKHNVLFAYKKNRCVCFDYYGMNQQQTTNRCNSECKCGNKAYHVVYKHFQGHQKPLGEKDQNFTCSAEIQGFGRKLIAVTCDSCHQAGYTCVGIMRRRYLQWANNFTTEELINLTTGLDNLYCPFIDNKNGQYKMNEIPCNKRIQGHCDMKHSGASDDTLTSKKVKTSKIEITTSMMSTTEKDPTSVVSIVETTSAMLHMDKSTYETPSTSYLTYSNKVSTSIDNSVITSKNPIGSILSSKVPERTLIEHTSVRGDSLTTLGVTKTPHENIRGFWNLTTIIIAVAVVLLIFILLTTLLWFKKRKSIYGDRKPTTGSTCYFNPQNNTELGIQMPTKYDDNNEVYAVNDTTENTSNAHLRPTISTSEENNEYHTLNFTMRKNIYQTYVPPVTEHKTKKTNKFRKSVNLLLSPFMKATNSDTVAAYSTVHINVEDVVYDVPKDS